MAKQLAEGGIDGSGASCRVARLSYVGVSPLIPWGADYGLVLLAALAYFLDGQRVPLLLGVLALLSFFLRFIGSRVRVAVTADPSDGAYHVTITRWGRRASYVAGRRPLLQVTRSETFLGRLASRHGNRPRGGALELALHLGGEVLPLPSLWLDVAFESRLAPFLEALNGLGRSGKAKSSRKPPEENDSFPKTGPGIPKNATNLTWMRAHRDAVLRTGARAQPVPAVARDAVFRYALMLVTLAIVLARQPMLERATRLGWAMGLGGLAVIIVAVASIATRLRVERGKDGKAAVVVSTEVLGFSLGSRRVPADDGLRMLRFSRDWEDSDGSQTAIELVLVERNGRAWPAGAPDRDGVLEAFGGELPWLAPTAPLASSWEAPPVAPFDEPQGEVPHWPAGGVQYVAAAAATVFLVTASIFAVDVLALSAADRWVETSYTIYTTHGKGGHPVTRASTVLDPSVTFPAPTNARGAIRENRTCWVLDHPGGHDIVRLTKPSGPPRVWEKFHKERLVWLRMSSVFVLLAFASWLRPLRGSAVRAG